MGGAVVGAAEVLHIVAVGHLHPGPLSVAALTAISLPSGALIGASFVGLLALVVPWSRRDWLHVTLGAWGVIWLSWAVGWFSDPPPFQPASWRHGDPLIFIGVGALVIALGWLVHRTQRARAVAGLTMVVLAVQALWGWAPLTSTHPAVGPNVLIVTLDTTRADRLVGLDAPGFTRVTEGGMRFDQAMAQIPVTGPSHLSLFSGVPPWSHGVLLNGAPAPPGLPWLPSTLRQRGYATAAFVSGYVLDGALGFERGFDVYDDEFGLIKGLDRTLAGRWWAMWQRHRDPNAIPQRRAGQTVDAALAWMERQHSPWMMWLHLYDAHGPYTPPPPYDMRFYRGRDPHDPTLLTDWSVPGYQRRSLAGITDPNWVISQYDGEIAYADSQLLRLLDGIPSLDDSLVVVVGDHGEGLGDHGEWFDHGARLFRHDLHVPLAIRWPGHVPAGRSSQALVALTDVAPTISGLLGLPIPKAMEGHDLSGMMEGGPSPRNTTLAVGYDRDANRAARRQNPSLAPRLRMAAAFTATEEAQLREVSPPTHPTPLQSVALHVLGLPAPPPPTLSPADRARLEALGYLNP